MKQNWYVLSAFVDLNTVQTVCHSLQCLGVLWVTLVVLGPSHVLSLMQ